MDQGTWFFLNHTPQGRKILSRILPHGSLPPQAKREVEEQRRLEKRRLSHRQTRSLSKTRDGQDHSN